MDIIYQQIISGLAMGSMYSLVALGYSMIWSAMEVVNFAQGEFFMLGAVFGVILFKTIGFSFFISVLFAVIILVIIGLLVRQFIVKPLRDREHLMVIIATAALSLLFKTSVIVWWGPVGEAFPYVFGENTYNILGFLVVRQYIWIMIIGFLLMSLLFLFFKRANIGIKMRAVAQDRFAARILGINTDKTDAVTFAISSALAGIAGILMAPIFFVRADMGNIIGLKGFICAIIGGFGSIPGAMIGGLMLGVIENIVTCYISSGYRDAISFLMLIFILYFLPEGLLKRRIERRI